MGCQHSSGVRRPPCGQAARHKTLKPEHFHGSLTQGVIAKEGKEGSKKEGAWHKVSKPKWNEEGVCVERVTWGVELEPKLGEEGGLGVGMIHCRISEPKVGEEGF